MFGKKSDQGDQDEIVRKKIKDGWIKSSMFIEVMAVSEDVAKSSLESHIEKMRKEDETVIYGVEFKGIKKIENPFQGIQTGYSNIVELFVLTASFDKLLHLAMNYGPTNIEILEPMNISVPAGEAQAIANSVADMIHKFARATIGGMPINLKKQEPQA